VKFTPYSQIIFCCWAAPIITGKVPFCDVFFSSPAIPNMGDWSLDCILYGKVGHKLFWKIKNTQRRRTWEMIIEKSVDEQRTSRRRTGLQGVNSQPNFANTKKLP
jgi:hypothetical protein